MSKSCFICDPLLLDPTGERERHWKSLTILCREHRRLAILESETSLDQILKDKIYPLDGSLLPYLLNPLQTQGIQSWCWWDAGMYHISGEVFVSNNYAEFELQHRARHIDALWSIWKNRDALGAMSPQLALVNLFSTLGPEFVNSVAHMAEIVQMNKNLTAGLAQQPSGDELASRIRGTFSSLGRLAADDDIFATVPDLITLAERRFALLREST